MASPTIVIDVIDVEVEDKGKYKCADVTYKSNGETKQKKLMSFGAAAEAFQILSRAKKGDTFTVSQIKNDKGYLDWVKCASGVGTVSAAAPSGGGSNTTPSRSFETAEERASRQVLIVRQSSVSNAVEFFALNTKKVPTVQEVVEVAKFFESYVFGKTSSPEQSVAEMDDDIPL